MYDSTPPTKTPTHATHRHPIAIIMLALAMITLPAAGAVVNNQTAQPWLPTDRIMHVHADPDNNRFGSSIDVHQDTAVIANPDQQTVHVYENTNGLWTEETTLSGPDNFGDSVALGAERMVISERTSLLHVYEKQQGWTKTAELEAPQTGCLGWDMDLLADRILASDPCNTDAGHLFTYENGAWNHTVLEVPGDVGYVLSTALAEDIAALAAWASVYLYEPSDQSWELEETISLDSLASRALDISGSLLVASGDGTAEVFEATGDGWTHTAQLSPADASPIDKRELRPFGHTLSIAPDTIVVGAPRDDASPGVPRVPELVPHVCLSPCIPPTDPGAAYVFEESEGEWEQTAKLTGPSESDEWFSFALALSGDGDQLLVGAPGHLHRSSVTHHLSHDVEDTVYVFSSLDEAGP